MAAAYNPRRGPATEHTQTRVRLLWSMSPVTGVASYYPGAANSASTSRITSSTRAWCASLTKQQCNSQQARSQSFHLPQLFLNAASSAPLLLCSLTPPASAVLAIRRNFSPTTLMVPQCPKGSSYVENFECNVSTPRHVRTRYINEIRRSLSACEADTLQERVKYV